MNMPKKISKLFWSDRWAIENNMAWFVAGNINILFSVNMVTSKYKIIAPLPGDFQGGFRLNPSCIKCEDNIFCMPDNGDCIWCYQLTTEKFQKIEIINLNHMRIRIVDFWQCGNTLWAVSIGLKQVIEIDTKEKRIKGYYDITNDAEEGISKSIKIENHIYTVSALRGRVYEFDIKTKEIRVYEFAEIEDGLRTISEFQNEFYLSGYKREIYIWNKNNNMIRRLDSFPANFGIYYFQDEKKGLLDCVTKEYSTINFLENVIVGDYVWFIPFQTNQILYVNTSTHEINAFEIEDEEENVQSLRNREMNHKYILQYVREERYIGLYSLKNKMLYEIDARKLKVNRPFITFNTEGLEKVFPDWVLRENKSTECFLYKILIEKNVKYKMKEKNVGTKIYNFLR